MIIVPAINCKDEKCVKERLDLVDQMNPEWVHFDVSDGKFDPVVNWNEPVLFANRYSPIANIEVHLMIVHPQDFLVDWLEVGAKRLILHMESQFDIDEVRRTCDKYEAELFIALKPETSADSFLSTFADIQKIDGVQILAVEPGLSGQSFKPKILEKIPVIKKMHPNVIIEVDGGVSSENLKLIKRVGVDYTVVGSSLFSKEDPVKAFKTLSNESSKSQYPNTK